MAGWPFGQTGFARVNEEPRDKELDAVRCVIRRGSPFWDAKLGGVFGKSARRWTSEVQHAPGHADAEKKPYQAINEERV